MTADPNDDGVCLLREIASSGINLSLVEMMIADVTNVFGVSDFQRMPCCAASGRAILWGRTATGAFPSPASELRGSFEVVHGIRLFGWIGLVNKGFLCAWPTPKTEISSYQ